MTQDCVNYYKPVQKIVNFCFNSSFKLYEVCYEPNFAQKVSMSIRGYPRLVDKIWKFSKKEDEMSDVFEYLFPCDASPGDVIIQQGDEGDNFYIIDQVKLMLMS